MIANSDLFAMAIDPVQLGMWTGKTPDPWQADILRSSAKEIILNCSRQAGKSTVTSILAVHEALFNPKALVLIFSPTLRQSRELFIKIKNVYHSITGKTGYWEEKETGLELTLTSGARIVALPGNKEANIRGFSEATLLLVDEASRVLDVLYQAVRPMLAVSGGRIVLMSTPWGRRGFFYEEWVNGGPRWHRIEIPATKCSRISPEFLADERKSLPPMIFNQEYMCQFAEVAGAVFTFDEVEAALDEDLQALF